MSKSCRFCGAELPNEANFCPFCAKSQIEKEAPRIPVPRRKKIILTGVILALILAAVLILRYQMQPVTADNGSAEVVYRHDGETWHVLLRNAINDDFHWKTAQDTFSRMCPAGTQGAIPLQLYAYDESSGRSVAEEFRAMIDSSEVKAVPRNGAVPMECSNPVENPGFSMAALVSDIVFDTDCQTNDITWTIRLNNRDTVVLHETAEILTNPELDYSWTDTPLSSSGELQALLETIKTEVSDPNTVVNITLAPIVYEGGVDITGRAVNLYGTSGAEGSTVIRGCLSIDNRNPIFATFENIIFEGSGTGIFASEGFVANNCSFTGLDTGILAADGSWPVLDSCSFESCGTGLHFNSSESSMKSAYYYGLSFIGNDTGVFLEKVPGSDVFYFDECIFEGNGQDINNLAGNEISYSLETGP